MFINNHVTPFFGKLLAEGRKAVKAKKLHSVWLNKDGCYLRFAKKGKEFSYRSTKELNSLYNAKGPSVEERSRKRAKPDDNSNSPNDVQRAKK